MFLKSRESILKKVLLKLLYGNKIQRRNEGKNATGYSNIFYPNSDTESLQPGAAALYF
jgi:hypothetical protein